MNKHYKLLDLHSILTFELFRVNLSNAKLLTSVLGLFIDIIVKITFLITYTDFCVMTSESQKENNCITTTQPILDFLSKLSTWTSSLHRHRWHFLDPQSFSEYFGIFWFFTKFSFPHKWNDARLLLMVYKSMEL